MMIKQSTRVQIHRFNEYVAFATSDKEGFLSDTLYIDADTARDLAIALQIYAQDVHHTDFTKSCMKTTTVGPDRVARES